MSIVENIAEIRERVAGAARRAGRSPDDVTLMAVTKTFPVDAIREAYAAGIRVFGENRVQEFGGKCDGVRDLAGAEWHMIGHLQTNKAGKAVELFSAIDSIDSVKLAERINAAGQAAGKKVDVLIEVNVGGAVIALREQRDALPIGRFAHRGKCDRPSAAAHRAVFEANL